MQVGSLKEIKLRGRAILIEFDINKTIPPIPFDKINSIKTLLDIRDWEMHRTHWAVKDEDLFSRLRHGNLLPNDAVEPTGSQELPEPNPADTQVDSVGAFITAVLNFKKNGKEVFYRGHSRKNKYRLEPSLFRTDSKGNHTHLDEEHCLYRELIVSNSADFQGDFYCIDRLVRMQHYSLPTRLLDITSNPLIALYFACRSHGVIKDGEESTAEEAGEVIVFFINKNDIKYFDSDTVSCLSNLSRLQKLDKDSIDYNLNAREFNRQAPIKRLIHLIREEKPFFESRIKKDDLRSVICVKGKRSNDRISFQSGAFLLYGHDAILDELGTPEIDFKRIEVTNKSKMIEELDQLNINERTVFPYIENSARYIAKKFAIKR